MAASAVALALEFDTIDEVTGFREVSVHHSKTPPCVSLAFILLALALLPHPLRAQATGDSSLVAVGDRVRASTSNGAIVGQVTRSDAQGIELVDGGLHLSLAYGELNGLAVSDGIRSRWRLGAGLGAVTGAIAGWGNPDVRGSSSPSTGDRAKAALIAGALSSVVYGAIGALLRREVWESIPLGGYQDRPGSVATPERQVLASPEAGSQPAGDGAHVVVGQRVRASTANSTFIGRVTRLKAQGIELMDGGTHLSLAYRGLDRLEVDDGVRSLVANGAGIGAGAGAVVGFLVDFSMNFSIFDSPDSFREQWGITLLGSALGGVAGGAIGALIKREAWKSVPLEDSVDSFSPTFGLQWHGPERRLLPSVGGRISF